MTATADTMFDVGFHADFPVVCLRPHPHNPRRDLGDLAELAASIAVAGVLQPITALADGTIVMGHRRAAAAEVAGLEKVPVIVAALDEVSVEAAMLVENVQRANLLPTEEGDAFLRLAERELSQRDIAGLVGCNQSHVSKRLALVTRLVEPKARQAVDAGGITLEEALAVAKLPPESQTELFRGGIPGDWQIRNALNRHERDQENAARLADLAAAGARQLEQRPPFGTWESAHRAGYTGEAPHETLPCFAFWMNDGTIVEMCLDPDSHDTAGPDDEDDDAQEVASGEERRPPVEPPISEEDQARHDHKVALWEAQQRRRAFIADMAFDPVYVVGVLLDGAEMYDLMAFGDTYQQLVGIEPTERNFDGDRHRAEWPRVVARLRAEPALAGRVLTHLAADTAESVMSVQEPPDKPWRGTHVRELDEDQRPVVQFHLAHLEAAGYEISPAERLYVWPDGIQEHLSGLDEATPKADLSNRAGCIDFLLGHPDHRGLVEQVAAAPDKAAAEAAVCEQMHKRNLVSGEYWLEGTADGVRLGHLNVKLSWAEIVARALKTQAAGEEPEMDGATEDLWEVSCTQCGSIAAGDTEAEGIELADEHRQNHDGSDPVPEITVIHEGLPAYLRISHAGGPYLTPHSQAELDAESAAADGWETDPPPSRPHAVAVSGPKGRGARKWSAVCSECDFDHKFTTERFATEAAAAHERSPETLEVQTA